MIIASYPQLELTSMVCHTTHSQDITYTIVSKTDFRERGYRKKEFSMSQTILLEEGDLQTAPLLLYTSDQRMIRIPRYYREQPWTGRVVDITTRFNGEYRGYETETNSNSFVNMRTT